MTTNVAPPAPQGLIGTPASIHGVTAITSVQQRAPVLLVAGREKDGKSSLATTLFGFPTPNHQPLVIAADPSGPDSCLNLGYAVHAVHLHKQQGANWFARGREALSVIERNITSIKQQYGALVFDDASTLSYRMLEDARRGSRNPDPRSHYQTMYTQFNELWWRLADMDMPVIWLAWSGEQSMAEDGKVAELAAPDIAGKRFARTIAGRAQHVFVLEKRKVGLGGAGADQHGYGRLLHTIPWNGQNAGGRLSHLLPEPIPANLGAVLRAATGMGP